MSDVYICETSYHLLITLIKASINQGSKYKLILGTGKVIDSDVIKRIEESNLFESIERYDGLEKYDTMLDYSGFFPLRGISLRKQLDRFVQWNYNKSDDYYMYNDVSILGKWFNAHKIKYHLIEDGLDTYTLPTVHSNNYPESKTKRAVRQFFNAGFYCFGESKYTSSIEVNKMEGLQFDKRGKNIIVVPRKELFSKLSNSDKRRILEIYLGSKKVNDIKEKLLGKEGTLLLTQPLSFDAMTSREIHRKFYLDIAREYAVGQLIIKPHPRDDMDYHELFPEALVIEDKYLPVETLGFLEGITISKAVTWCSTSINGLDFCEEKISLGIEYIKPYLKMDEGFESKWSMAGVLLGK